MTLSELGISKDIAAAGVKLLALSNEEIEAKAAEATEHGKDFSCKRCVAEVRMASADPMKKVDKEAHEEIADAIKNAVTKFAGKLTTKGQFDYVRSRVESLLHFLHVMESECGNRGNGEETTA